MYWNLLELPFHDFLQKVKSGVCFDSLFSIISLVKSWPNMNTKIISCQYKNEENDEFVRGRRTEPGHFDESQ